MNRKTYHNDYSNNNKCYNNTIKKTEVTYPKPKKPYNNSSYNSEHVLSGGEASGTVWTNPQVYNVRYYQNLYFIKFSRSLGWKQCGYA